MDRFFVAGTKFKASCCRHRTGGERKRGVAGVKAGLFPPDNAIISAPLVRNARFHRPLPSSMLRPSTIAFNLISSPVILWPACRSPTREEPPHHPRKQNCGRLTGVDRHHSTLHVGRMNVSGVGRNNSSVWDS